MFKKMGVLGTVVFFLMTIVSGGWSNVCVAGEGATAKPLDAKAALEKAEAFIRPWQAGNVDVTMSYKKNGQPVQQTFKVYFSDAKALVVFQSPADQTGNLMLLIDNDMWYYEKGTSHAVKVPELHKTSGQVPCADIPRLIWAKDYAAEIDTNIDPKNPGPKDVAATKISIKTNSPGLTYKRGYVWIKADTLHPVQAQLYFSSGKKARTVKFMEFATVSGKTAVREIQVIDHLNLGKTYTLRYDNFLPEAPPDKYFSELNLPALAKELAPGDEPKKELPAGSSSGETAAPPLKQ